MHESRAARVLGRREDLYQLDLHLSRAHHGVSLAVNDASSGPDQPITGK